MACVPSRPRGHIVGKGAGHRRAMVTGLNSFKAAKTNLWERARCHVLCLLEELPRATNVPCPQYSWTQGLEIHLETMLGSRLNTVSPTCSCECLLPVVASDVG